MGIKPRYCNYFYSFPPASERTYRILQRFRAGSVGAFQPRVAKTMLSLSIQLISYVAQVTLI